MRKCLVTCLQPELVRVGYVVRASAFQAVEGKAVYEVIFWAGVEPKRPESNWPSLVDRGPDGFSRIALRDGGCLLSVAARFEAGTTIRPGDIVTRIDGDEIHFLEGGE